jgi:ABC-type transport system involved in multi-copper enzyme maturation permease subunit
MIDKEIRSAAWKFGLIAFVVLVTLTQIPTPYEEIVEMANMEREFLEEELPQIQEEGLSEQEAREMYGPPPDPVDNAMNELAGAYANLGAGAMVVLAGLLGIGLVSSEVGGGTIFALLSRPISRRRLFLTKYIVCASFLLAAAVLGAVALFLVALLRDYPLGEITWPGVVLAVVLMWLASLFVLGIAILVSIFTPNVMASLIATAAAVFLILALPSLITAFVNIFLWNEFRPRQFARLLYEVSYTISLSSYWPDPGYFWPGGNSFKFGPPSPVRVSKTVDFVVCFFAAAIPFAASLWLFERKKF